MERMSAEKSGKTSCEAGADGVRDENATTVDVSAPACRATGDVPDDTDHADSGADGSRAKPKPVPDEPRADGDGATGSTRRWCLAVAVGLIVSVPLAWLLSYAATLFFLLGLFFYALFGLIIGASVYRVAALRKPYGQSMVLIGTTVIVLFTWVFSLAKESRDFPSDIASQAAESRRLWRDHLSSDEYRARVRQEVLDYLRRDYPPGGTIGYMRWIATSGWLKPGDLPSVRGTLRRDQARYWWIIRVVLSVGLLAFGVGSQTFLLTSPRTPSNGSTDTEPAPPVP